MRAESKTMGRFESLVQVNSTSYQKTHSHHTWEKSNNKQGRVVQKVDDAIHRINHYPADSVVCFVNTYPLDSDLSGR